MLGKRTWFTMSILVQNKGVWGKEISFLSLGQVPTVQNLYVFMDLALPIEQSVLFRAFRV